MWRSFFDLHISTASTTTSCASTYPRLKSCPNYRVHVKRGVRHHGGLHAIEGAGAAKHRNAWPQVTIACAIPSQLSPDKLEQALTFRE
jgi:hypothetical protein